MPNAFTRIRTLPISGLGLLYSVRHRFSGPPLWAITIAFMILYLLLIKVEQASYFFRSQPVIKRTQEVRSFQIVVLQKQAAILVIKRAFQALLFTAGCGLDRRSISTRKEAMVRVDETCLYK